MNWPSVKKNSKGALNKSKLINGKFRILPEIFGGLMKVSMLNVVLFKVSK